jgi:hypothetical protein
VFPGASGSVCSYSAFATAPKKVKIYPGSAHSWRSIFRDWAGDIGRIDRDLAEAALAHALPSVEGSYRRMTAVEARRGVMESYSRWLMGEAADNVVPLKRA